MDKIDSQILKKLIKNPTKSFLKISKEMGVSPSTVQKRYKKMQNKVFFPPTIIMDLRKVGFQGKAYFLIKNKSGIDRKLTLDAVDDLPNLFIIAETIGKFDYVCLAAFRDIADLKKIIYKIRENPSIERVEIALTEQTDFPMKREYGPLQLLNNQNFNDEQHNKESI
jgi:DNA-binding Lrp family transcriptional regulator